MYLLKVTTETNYAPGTAEPMVDNRDHRMADYAAVLGVVGAKFMSAAGEAVVRDGARQVVITGEWLQNHIAMEYVREDGSTVKVTFEWRSFGTVTVR